MTTEPVRQLRRDAEANRRQILDAARRVMAERGLSAPLEEISSEAGVGIATLYRRFPSRADLVEALLADCLDDYVGDLAAAIARPDGWDGLAWFLERAASRMIADRALRELVEHSVAGETIEAYRAKLLELAEKLIRRARATGRLRPDFTASDLFFCQTMLVAVGSATGGTAGPIWTRYLTILLDGLVTERSGPSRAAVKALTHDQLTALQEAKPAYVDRVRA